MYCPKCGKQIPDGSVYCMHCGRPIPVPPDTAPSYVDDPFGNIDEIAFPEDSQDFYEPPVREPETFSSGLERDDLLELPEEDLLPPPQKCIVCGRDLPRGNTTGICVTCTTHRSILASAQDEQPTEPPSKKKKRLPLLPILIAALLMASVACFAAYYMQNGGLGTSMGGSAPVLDDTEKQAAKYAQDMVKAKAANPASVHFDSRSLKVAKDGDAWTVTQSFERLAPTGEMAESAYTAVLALDSTAPEGYRPLMLKVDDTVLYDNR